MRRLIIIERNDHQIQKETLFDFKSDQVITAKQLAELLQISLTNAYTLLNSKSFPTLHVGSRKLVTKKNLAEWMNNHTNPI